MSRQAQTLGNRIAPPRFLAFCGVALVAVPLTISFHGWSLGTMIGFDIAAFVFLAASIPLLRNTDAATMRAAAKRNDANRTMLLVIATAASVAVLAAVAVELSASTRPDAGIVALIIATLILAWTFGNTVYALHYAHLFYSDDGAGKDSGGIDFPGTNTPEYWDFVYFSFTLGMTFQTSDVAMTTTAVRKVATAHCLVAFVFNLGVIAFTINVLGGS